MSQTEADALKSAKEIFETVSKNMEPERQREFVISLAGHLTAMVVIDIESQNPTANADQVIDEFSEGVKRCVAHFKNCNKCRTIPRETLQ